MIEHLRKLWCAGNESPHGIELLRSLSHSVALDQGDDNKSYVKVVDWSILQEFSHLASIILVQLNIRLLSIQIIMITYMLIALVPAKGHVRWAGTIDRG